MPCDLGGKLLHTGLPWLTTLQDPVERHTSTADDLQWTYDPYYLHSYFPVADERPTTLPLDTGQPSRDDKLPFATPYRPDGRPLAEERQPNQADGQQDVFWQHERSGLDDLAFEGGSAYGSGWSALTQAGM